MPPAMAAIKCAKLSSSGIKWPRFAAKAFELDPVYSDPAVPAVDPAFGSFVLLIVNYCKL